MAHGRTRPRRLPSQQMPGMQAARGVILFGIECRERRVHEGVTVPLRRPAQSGMCN
jgi:hypothetical protein